MIRAPMHALTDPHAGPDSALRVSFRDEPLPALLAQPGMLAVFGFGGPPPASEDPRYRGVALPLLGPARFECWHVDGPVSSGHDHGVAWSDGGGLQAGLIEVDDPADGDAAAVAADAYARLQAWLERSSCRHVLRTWNYLDGITAGDGDTERYRRFCVGRARGIGHDQSPDALPAATAIGHPRPSGRFQLAWLAAREPGRPIENPRQVAAWQYPRQYGPQAPGFARALLPPDPTMPLLLSGTAAVVGHESRHADALDAQLDEILANLASLAGAARAARPSLPGWPAAGARIRAYVRDADAMPRVDALLAERLPAVPRLVLHGHVCRRELAVELDGVHG